MMPRGATLGSIEKELVAVLTRTPLPTTALRAVNALLAQPVDWDAVFNTAAEWELEPVVLANLRLHFSTAMSREVLDRVQSKEREMRAWALSRSLLTVDIATGLERAGIPTIVLKGPAVSIVAYGDITLRIFSDVDLLVSPKDLLPAVRFLLDRGYRRDYDASAEARLVRSGHALEFSDGKNKVELHAQLLSRHLRLNIETREIWESSRTIPAGPGTIRVLGTPLLLLFLCAHGAKHMWSNVRWLADIANLIDQLSDGERQQLLELSRRTHSKRILALGIRMARIKLGVTLAAFSDQVLVPEADTAGLLEQAVGVRPTASTGEILMRKLEAVHPNMTALIFWAKCRERIVDRVMCLGSVLFVPSEKERSDLLGWIQRPARLTYRALQRVVR